MFDTLGSTTAVANVVAGIVITYTRAFRTGDFVRIADTEGKIIERTAFVTRIRTAKNVDEAGSPSESLHETDGEGLVAWDDVSGQELDPQLMKAARRDENKYFREMGVYDKVDIAEAWKATGKAPIAVRWVDINKGDTKTPLYRSRLVAKEFNTDVCPELYAATLTSNSPHRAARPAVSFSPQSSVIPLT